MPFIREQMLGGSLALPFACGQLCWEFVRLGIAQIGSPALARSVASVCCCVQSA